MSYRVLFPVLSCVFFTSFVEPMLLVCLSRRCELWNRGKLTCTKRMFGRTRRIGVEHCCTFTTRFEYQVARKTCTNALC